MKTRDLVRIGIPPACAELAKQLLQRAQQERRGMLDVLAELERVARGPGAFREHLFWGPLAAALEERATAARGYIPREAEAPFRVFGEGLEPTALQQLRNACRLPVSVAAALMPDAHQGYGLPIGGVLATREAVIPYAVGVDIACRMKLSVLDLGPEALATDQERLARALEAETRFGVGAEFKQRRQHAVMDADWGVTRITSEVKDRAWAQLGTSGSGNHFVEYGLLTVLDGTVGLPVGEYLALLSHSGSRGAGGLVAQRYSKVAREQRKELPQELSHLAWLDLATESGQEYWAAMELMGRYAAANHELIHAHVVRALGATVRLDIENHHNFAWREKQVLPDGTEAEVIVHRKGATPAGAGVLGIIPGSMGTPGYVVRGRGAAAGLQSASHGAGRRMSRTKAKETVSWGVARRFLRERNVTLLSAGLDEVPMAYKDIEEVMAAQQELVEPLARFEPRLVKMAPGSEPAED